MNQSGAQERAVRGLKLSSDDSSWSLTEQLSWCSGWMQSSFLSFELKANLNWNKKKGVSSSISSLTWLTVRSGQSQCFQKERSEKMWWERRRAARLFWHQLSVRLAQAYCQTTSNLVGRDFVRPLDRAWFLLHTLKGFRKIRGF